MNPTPMPPAFAQRGAAALVTTLLLLVAALLVLLGANRALLLELRMSANQVHSTAAFEAAEAGLEWAGALLNSPAPLGDDCRPGAVVADSFRERYLAAGAAGLGARTWLRGGVAVPRQAACAHDDGGWHCHCPADADAAPPAADGPAFTLQFADGGRPGVLRLAALGCNRQAGACRADGLGRAEGHARVEALFARQPALARPPATALTLRPPAQEADRFFAEVFGLSRAAWPAQPGVHTLACRGDCGAALVAAIGGGVRPVIRVDGDLLLRGPLVLGSAERPVLIVAGGAVQLQGEVTLHGVLYAERIGWTAATGPLRGALLAENGASGDTTLDLAHDGAVLERLQARAGRFVRLPGSWRDF